MTYTWTITTKTMKKLNLEHRMMLRRMISQLLATYETCEEKERDFQQVFTLLTAFRDIILSWPYDEYSAAFEEITEWQRSFIGGL